MGTATCSSAGRSVYDAPGVPASCSTKYDTALPRSMHEPPPKLTMPSTPSRRACSMAACTADAGTWERTPPNVDATTRSSRATSRTPSGDASRPAVDTTSTRRAPRSRTMAGQQVEGAGTEVDPLGVPGVHPRRRHQSSPARASSRMPGGTPLWMNHSMPNVPAERLLGHRRGRTTSR